MLRLRLLGVDQARPRGHVSARGARSTSISYVNEFVGHHNIRGLTTMQRMGYVVTQLIGRWLAWDELTAG